MEIRKIKFIEDVFGFKVPGWLISEKTWKRWKEEYGKEVISRLKIKFKKKSKTG